MGWYEYKLQISKTVLSAFVVLILQKITPDAQSYGRIDSKLISQHLVSFTCNNLIVF